MVSNGLVLVWCGVMWCGVVMKGPYAMNNTE